MNLCTALVEALYQVFSTPMVFPSDADKRFYQALCDLGYASESSQGHANSFRITPSGYQVAMARWGHEQR